MKSRLPLPVGGCPNSSAPTYFPSAQSAVSLAVPFTLQHDCLPTTLRAHPCPAQAYTLEGTEECLLY